MEFSNNVEKHFFDIIKFYNIKINENKLTNIDTRKFYSEIILLKSKKVIYNTEFVLLNKIRDEILQIQRYNDSNSYTKLNEYLKHISSYNNKKSSNNETNFLDVINYISSSSKESIVNSEEFNSFNEYLHVHRPIETKLESALEQLQFKDKGIILLVGSVGDGKSHLLSYFNKNKPDLFNNVYIYNDATESNNPYKTAVQTLAEKLENFESGKLNKLVIAINIGVLHNLKEYLKSENKSTKIIKTIESSNIFSTDGMNSTLYESENFSIVSFLNETNFEIIDGKIISNFYNSIFTKVFKKDLSNPFYNTFIKDDGENRSEPTYQNYLLMLNEKVQEAIVHLLIKIQVENKRIISTRALLNFIHDIIVPDANDKENDSFLVNLLFDSYDKSTILSAVSLQDPVLIQDAKIDQLNIEIYNSLDLQNKCEELFGENDYNHIYNYLYLLDGLSHKRKFEMIIRLHYLFNNHQYELPAFYNFINMINNIESNKQLQKSLLKMIFNAIYEWKGSPLDGFIYNESLKPDTSLRIGLQFNPKPKRISVTNNFTVIVTFEIQDELYEIEVDYTLYLLMEKISNGYILKEKDKIESVVFSEFVDNILNDLKSNQKTVINIPGSNETYMISEGFLGYEIERVER